jgi:hypothetical protein
MTALVRIFLSHNNSDRVVKLKKQDELKVYTIMGMVLGKTGVAEPIYESLLSRSSVKTPYEIRQYGTRYAIETDYSGDKTSNAFRSLAGYIGVGTAAQNEGSAAISMTAPVVTSKNTSNTGTSIAMTAPVVTTSNLVSKKTMLFYLPTEYDEMSKIPKPTNSLVRVLKIPPALGVTHKFDGWVDDKKAESKVASLVTQLKEDGLEIQEENAMQNYLLWQFNPPFTIPKFRRNEVWIPLTQTQVDEHLKRFAKDNDSQATSV